MNYALIPDLAAMVVLIIILLILRRRHPKKSVDLWLLGLLFVFIEGVARFFYINPHTQPHRLLLHAIALDSYVLAGMIFTSGAGRESFTRRNRLVYLVLNTTTLLTAVTLYGFDCTSRNLYLVSIATGLIVGVVSSIWLHRSWPLILANLAGWLPMAWFASRGSFREATYWSLFCLFMLAALAFQKTLPRKSIGRIAIFAGFVVWATCFLAHPWVLPHPIWQNINDTVWNMQKFLISIGMLIVMLEDQINSNEYLALHDQLTGLPNRRLFDDRLAQALGRSQRMHTSVALIMIDLDGFKAINDSYGHAGGDELLRGIAANLARIVRSSDTLARLGGDEFVVLAGDLAAENVQATSIPRLVEAIQNAIQKPVNVGGREVAISGSLGVAIAPDDSKTADLLFAIADRRMYRAKKQNAYARTAHALEPRTS